MLGRQQGVSGEAQGSTSGKACQTVARHEQAQSTRAQRPTRLPPKTTKARRQHRACLVRHALHAEPRGTSANPPAPSLSNNGAALWPEQGAQMHSRRVCLLFCNSPSRGPRKEELLLKHTAQSHSIRPFGASRPVEETGKRHLQLGLACTKPTVRKTAGTPAVRPLACGENMGG